MLCGCGFSLRDMFAKQGFDYPVHVWRRLVAARRLSPENKCEPAAETRPLLEAGLADVTNAQLEQLAWRRCPAGSEAALFHAPFVHVSREESSFAMVLTCFGVEEPVPGFAAAAARENAGMMGHESDRLIDGWDYIGIGDYWEARNVVLFSRRGGAFAYRDVLAHFSRDRALADYVKQPGQQSELEAALSCTFAAQRGEAP
jgi:hypothetical protein